MTKTARLVVYVPPADLAALTREAQRRGLSLGELVRRSLRYAIQRGTQNSDQAEGGQL